MKLTKSIIIFMMLIAMIISITQPVFGRGGKETPSGEPLYVTDPRAPGMTLSGTLALYYEERNLFPVDCDADCVVENDSYTKMIFFMRLIDGKNLLSFGGIAPNLFCYWDIPKQQQAIQEFLYNVVRPKLYSLGVIENEDACFAFKSVEKVVESQGTPFLTDSPVFTLMDIVIAIDEKNICPWP